MNADYFKGKWNQFKGSLKKKWGEFTDDDLLKIEGDYDKFKGAIQERYADRKDEISRWADEWYRSSQAQDSVGQPGRKQSDIYPALLLCLREEGGGRVPSVANS